MVQVGDARLLPSTTRKSVTAWSGKKLQPSLVLVRLQLLTLLTLGLVLPSVSPGPEVILNTGSAPSIRLNIRIGGFFMRL